MTCGIHHVGLTVCDLEAGAAFFTSLLNWQEVRRREDYPAIYVSDGNTMVTLWAAKEEPASAFNRHRNIGLHHLALRVASETDLHRVHEKLAAHGVTIEFAPEPLGKGPARHMMCQGPSGIRLEFIWPGQ